MPKKNITKDSSFDLKSISDSFFNNMDHTKQFIKDIEPFAISYDNKASAQREDLKNAINNFVAKSIPTAGKNTNNEPNIRIISPPKMDNMADELITILNSFRIVPWLNLERVEILYKSALVIILSYFDCLLADILRYYYVKYPQSLPDDLHITLSEFKTCQDYEEAMDMIIDKKVDSILFGSLNIQKTYFKNNLKINIRENLINWDFLCEAIERRNAIIHNNSVVNNRYFIKIRNLSIPPALRLRAGETIIINKEYFKNVYDEILLAGISLLQTCWRKWDKNIEEADLKLLIFNDVIAANDEDVLLERLCLFSKEIKTHDIYYRNRFDLDYCLSLKRQGKISEFNKEIAKLDCSDFNPELNFIMSILKDDYVTAYKHFEHLVPNGGIVKLQFHTMPILIETEKIPEVHKELINIFKRITANEQP